MRGAAAPGAHPRVLEPTKCAEWQWCAWDSLPQPLFQPLRQLRENGYTPLANASSDVGNAAGVCQPAANHAQR